MRLHVFLTLLVAVPACATDDAPVDETGATAAPSGDPAAAERTRAYHFVTSTITIPTTSAQANALGFDLDGNGTVDNALGKVLASLSGQIDVAGAAQAALTDGSIVLLHSLRTGGLTKSKTAKWQIFIGDPQASPDLSGHGTFTVAADSPRDAIFAGSVAAKAFAGGPSAIAIALPQGPGSTPAIVHLVAAHATAGVTSTTCANGRLGGAVPMTDVNDVILPALANALDARLVADGCTADASACSSSDRTLLSILDTDGDRVITADELRSNAIVQAVLKPDVDVLGADGSPGQDGAKDSISIGIGFTCAAAKFSE
jgi:hypothetical protein